MTARTQEEQSLHRMRLANLAERVLLGPLTPEIRTPSRVVFRWDISTLLRYHGAKPPVHPIPVLFVPPLMAQPSCYDLWVGHSMIGSLVEAGFDVFVVDFGSPQKEHRTLTIDQYVVEFIHEALAQTLKATGAPNAFLAGWSMGGIMSCLYTAYWKRESRVAGLAILGSPIDFSRQFPLHQLARLAGTPVMKIVDAMGNIPGVLITQVFRMMAPVRRLTRYADLWRNYHDRGYIGAYESLSDWAENFLPYPGDAFKQFLDDYFRKDKLKRGELTLGGRRIQLADIRCPVFVAYGLADKLASPASVVALQDLVSSTDVTLVEVPMGHIGLVAGKTAPERVWRPMARWLRQRQPRQRPVAHATISSKPASIPSKEPRRHKRGEVT